MLKGIAALKEKGEEIRKNASKDRIRFLLLRNGDTARLRFLTDGEELITAMVHSVKETTTKGMRWRKYIHTDENCKWCAQGEGGAGEMLYLWAYVYNIGHTGQNAQMNEKTGEGKWERDPKTKLYVEPINSPMVFRTGPGARGAYRQSIVNFFEKHETLCDRDYDWKRTGSGKEDTNYSLMSNDPSKLSPEIEKVKNSLPDLVKVIEGKIWAFGQTEEEAKTADSESPKDIKKSDEDDAAEMF